MKAGIKFQKHGSYLIGTKYMLALLPADVMNQQLLRTIFQLSARLSWDFLWPLQYKAEYRTRDITGFRQNFWFFSRVPLIFPQKKHMTFADLHEKSWSFSESNPELCIPALISLAIQMYAIVQKHEGQCN